MIRLLAFLALVLATLPLTALPAQAQEPAFPLHGNWCGIGHGGGPWALQPIDPLDAACMRHDICTEQLGRFDCGCDIAFMQELRSQYWPNPEIADKARAIHDAIAMMPCSSPQGMAYKAACLASDLATDMMSGREMPMDILRRWGLVGATGLGNSYWNNW